ncbi:MAG: hypothetical protein WBQ89_28320, partial [Candidatus Acidiferrum sp.]
AMDTPEKLGTPQKALLINLDATVFGSFAEIGAGQEVARWFLRVGGASGTVAKTISAYDKEVSDDLYGAGTRYVSKPRLQAMLDSEWEQLLGQLQATRGATTKFFAFVDTISARNFSGTNDCHGWVGLRFLQQPGGPANDVILHVNLRDPSNVQQQETVGILGVNLLYAAQQDLKSPGEFLAGVLEELSLERLELDCMELKGPAFETWDRDELHALLVMGGHTEAVAFPADNNFVPSSELIYKRALVLAPGRFGNIEQLHADLIRVTLAELPPEELKESKGGLGLFCLSVAPGGAELATLPVAEIIKTVKELQKMGYGVMLFRAPELYMMSAFLNRYTQLRIHFSVGLSVLVWVLGDRYKNLPGHLLEGIARLFSQNVRLVVHPMTAEDVERRVKEAALTGWSWNETNGMVYADDLHPAKPLEYLYKYLLSEFWILPSKAAR